jgi:serine/threonine-protein kinase
MELLTGEDLAEMLRARPRLSLRDVVRLVREAGAGLDAARAAGIVHRDVNPHNLFAAESGETTVWKLLDFGVARHFEPGAGVTRAEVAGTPQYMAPELALGRDVGHRADLFSLAAVAYRALTGQAPFVGAGVPDTLMHVVHQMPARPSELCRVPVGLDGVLAVALAKDPELRFDSGAELAAAFERAARGEEDAELRARADHILQGLPWRAKVA